MSTPELKIQSAKRKVKTELYKGTTTDHAINEERPGRPPKDFLPAYHDYRYDDNV